MKPNSRKCIPAELKNSKIRETKLLRNFHATRYDNFIRSGNCERFGFSGNLNVFASRFQQSLIRTLRKFYLFYLFNFISR